MSGSERSAGGGAAGRAVALGLVLACGAVVDCRVRRDAPEGPAAERVTAPARSAVAAVKVERPPDASILVDADLPDVGDPPEGTAIIAFGGIGSPPEQPQPELRAVRAASVVVARSGNLIDAVTQAVVVLEDEPRRNAGTGSELRIDGETIEMDAAVMADDGRFAAVAAVQRVKNPALLARRVLDTPHRILSGAGARQFARLSGFIDYDPTTPAAKERWRRALSGTLADAGEAGVPEIWWRYVDAAARAPARSTVAEAGAAGAGDAGTAPRDAGADTVAALARSAEGGFAGAVSSGGPALALPGRVGDVPVPGAALWVGSRGAVACSGHAETLTRLNLAHAVYDKLAQVRSPKLAAQWGVKQATGTDVVVMVLDARSSHVEPPGRVAFAESADGERWSAEAGP